MICIVQAYRKKTLPFKDFLGEAFSAFSRILKGFELASSVQEPISSWKWQWVRWERQAQFIKQMSTSWFSLWGCREGFQSPRLQSMQELKVKKDDLYVSRVSPIPSIKALTFTEGVHSYSSDIGCLQVGQIFNFPQHKIKVWGLANKGGKWQVLRNRLVLIARHKGIQ